MAGHVETLQTRQRIGDAPAQDTRGRQPALILLKNLQLLFWTFFDWGRGQADQTQLRARQQLPTHRFCRL